MDFNKYKTLIQKLGLQRATQRNFSLLTLSCVSVAYTKYLKSYMGFEYTGIGGFGDKDGWVLLLNEDDIIAKTEKFVAGQKDLDAFIEHCHKNSDTIKQQLDLVRSVSVTELQHELSLYQELLGILGVYNCFWRFVGEEKDKLSEVILKKIGRYRDEIAGYYRKYNEKIESFLRALALEMNTNEQLLRLATVSELASLFSNWERGSTLADTFRERSDGYVYLATDQGEKATSDKKVIADIKKLFSAASQSNELKGSSAFGGKVRGAVFKKGSGEPPNKYILVAPMTHPDDILLIKKSIAIVTDEGGILSHAAIVSRELKKPCIIGTKIATQVLKNGDEVEVDANKGIVRILK